MKKIQSTLPELSRTAEEKKLEEILAIAQKNLEKAKEGIEQMGQDVAELYATMDHRDKGSLILWNDATKRLRQLKREMDRFEKARKKPYFGRIDFKDPTQKEEESYYIGRVGIAKTPSEPMVIDWRAPIASVYYENTLGPCQYTVSSEGTFEIDLLRKRTYTIENDKLKDFFDSDVVANDELLTSYLAKNKKAVLGEIIATIQKEQNLIIRRSPRTNMIVQGCAGSGKTTVAMHRISYILYNYEESFRPEDFYIIGSNKILLNYITSVLPELDVYGVAQMTMEELFVRLLYEDWDKEKHQIRPLDKQDEISCIKGTKEWFDKLEDYCERYEKEIIPRKEIYLEHSDTLLVGKVLIDTYCNDHPEMSVQAKCLMLNEILMSKYENEIQGKHVSYSAAEKKAMEKKYSTYFGKNEWKGSIFEEYEKFLKEQNITIEENSYDVYDLAALAYLYKRMKEIDPIREASHIVIDEAQDFGMMAYCCLHYCIRGCTYTIMGDTSQNIHFGYGLNDWEELRKLILTGTYDAFGLLKKSYRNTVEISNFAMDILRHGDFSIYPVEPIVRHGEEVQVQECVDRTDLYVQTVAWIKKWQSEGYETIAIVCRDEQETKEVWEQIHKYVEVQDGTQPDAEFGNGIMVLPVAYTKGLEFDAVLLFGPTEAHYPTENTYAKLLYVAATRALHQLVVLHDGNLTRLIAEPVPEDKHLKELSAPTLTKAMEYEKKQFTQKELIENQIKEGDKERSARGRFGPKKIVVQTGNADEEEFLRQKRETVKSQMSRLETSKLEKSNSGKSKSEKSQSERLKPEKLKSDKSKRNVPEQDARVNLSNIAYLSVPDTNKLRPKGHSKANFAVRWVKKRNDGIDLVSAAGVLSIVPITKEIIRVSFQKGQQNMDSVGYFNRTPENGTRYKVRENASVVELATPCLTVRVDKKSGAVQFIDLAGKMLLLEKQTEPRQMDENQNWTYFDWEKKEKIKCGGILKADFTDITGKARYISHGGKLLRMPLVASSKGYGIAVAAEDAVLCCNIASYGNYIYCDNCRKSDYYFLYGGDYEKTSELYEWLRVGI